MKYEVGTVIKIKPAVNRHCSEFVVGTVTDENNGYRDVGRTNTIKVHDGYIIDHPNYKKYRCHNFILSEVVEVISEPTNEHFDEELFEL